MVLATERGDQLVGITSWGSTNCYRPYGFYTNVATHLTWIQRHLADGGAAADVTAPFTAPALPSLGPKPLA